MTVLHGLQQYEYRECMGGTVKEDLFSLPKKILCNRRGFKNSTGDTKIVGEATYQTVDDMACVSTIASIKIKIFATIDLLKAVHLPLRCCEHLVPTTTYTEKSSQLLAGILVYLTFQAFPTSTHFAQAS